MAEAETMQPCRRHRTRRNNPTRCISGDTRPSDPDKLSLADHQLESLYQVLLHNDDWNTAEHVVDCLIRIFGHPLPLAVKIMWEAHHRGYAIAEVECETEAQLHCDQLQSCGLLATIEKV